MTRVRTDAGLLRGAERDGVHVFLGVPYAAPPVGALRFAAPSAAPAWEGERPATRFAPAPPQHSDAMDRRLGLVPAATGEDCLALNVWTPSPEGRRPVLVWIHGGGFETGTTDAPLYDGGRLAREGDVVVVSVGYRVGALGFVALGPGRANWGLQDQVAALRWVARHAASFGGDPGRVTVFGESAGAGSVVSLLAMPSARGLFQRAIVQSAAPDGMLELAEADERTARLLARVGCEAGDLDALRALPVEKLLAAQAEVAAEGPHRRGLLFLPVVDGEILPERPLEAARAGRTADVDLLIGTTREEMHLFALRGLGEGLGAGHLPAILAAQLAPEIEGDATVAAARVVEGLAAERRARGEPDDATELFYELQTGLGLRHHAIQLAERHAARGRPTFMYLFTWPSPMRGGRLRSCHAVDLPFVFGTLDAPGMAAFAGAGPGAEALSARVRAAWVAFARSGDPSHPGIGAWPRYDADRRATLELGAECRVLEAPGEAERRLWAGLPWRAVCP